MNTTRRLVPVSALVLVSSALAQTGRSITIVRPAVPGQVWQLNTAAPASAAGNLSGLLWSPPFAGTTPVVFPGITVQGLARVDINNLFVTDSGIVPPGGSQTYSWPLPNSSWMLGIGLDTQSMDLAPSGWVLSLSDNDVHNVVSQGIGTVRIAQATTTSTVTGDNDLQQLQHATIGAPVGQGFPAFAYLPILTLGNQGYAEGHNATFTASSYNSDIDSQSYRRPARRLNNLAMQSIVLPNGRRISNLRDCTNRREFKVAVYDESNGATIVIPGSTWQDTGPSSQPAQQSFYHAVSPDGRRSAWVMKDSNPVPRDRVMFNYDYFANVTSLDISPTTAPPQDYHESSLAFAANFLFAQSVPAGLYQTRLPFNPAVAPQPLQPVVLPNLTATNSPVQTAFPLSLRISRDQSAMYFPAGSAAGRAEMDVYRVTDAGGVPLAVNFTQFANPTALADWGVSAVTPAATNDSVGGIRAAVSPDGTKIAFLAGSASSNTTFPGLYVATGAANPPLRTVPGASFYSEVAFPNDNTVLFFAGPNNTTQSLYRFDVGAQTITQLLAPTDMVTRGQWYSSNGSYWYFLRSNAAGSRNDIVGVNTATLAVNSITGSEFGAGGAVGSLQTGGTNTTIAPGACVEMQLRRSPADDYAYFAARLSVGGGMFQDANVFRYDIEHGTPAQQLTNFTGTGATQANVRQIENLTISRDGNHVVFSQRLGTAGTNSEELFLLGLFFGAIQFTKSDPLGQTITDGSVQFTPDGVAWSIGSGSTSVPLTNTRVEFAPFGATTPVRLTQPVAGSRLIQVLGAH